MKADLAKEWLSSEGYKYDADHDGDIHFKYQGHHLFFTTDDDDSFLRIIMPNIYEEEGNHIKVLEACNTITRDIKVVKAFVVDGHMWLSIEMFIDSTPELSDFCERCCDILVAAFHQAAKEILN